MEGGGKALEGEDGKTAKSSQLATMCMKRKHFERIREISE
jgi:hypothetical protein